MSRKLKIGIWVVLGIVLVLTAAVLILNQLGDFRFKPPVRRSETFVVTDPTRLPSRLQAAGNQLVDASGQVVQLRGVMVQDPDELDQRGRFTKAWFEQVKALGANVVRIPVHPEPWSKDREYLWRYLDPVVRWAGELGMYVIIDWHYIGNILTGVGEYMPDIVDKPADLSREFWQQTADYFKEAPHVLFEIYNEPAEISEAAWRPMAQELVDIIRETGAEQLVIVSGLDWTSNLRMYLEKPIEDLNTAYSAHIYPQHSSRLWDAWFGELAQKYPVLVTEWGFMDENRAEGPDYLRGDAAGYGQPLLDTLNQRGIGWVACWYDDAWLPQMLTSEGAFTSFGRFTADALKE